MTKTEARDYNRIHVAASELLKLTRDRDMVCAVLLEFLLAILVARFGFQGAIERLSGATNAVIADWKRRKSL